MIEAVTFDLWDTIIRDDSDEPRRVAQGLRPKREARRHLVWEALNEDASAPIDHEAVAQAYDVADAAFNKVWHDQHVTWTIQERLSVLLEGLGRSLAPERFEALARAHERMELEVAPDAVEGIADAVASLAQRYKLCIVSDTIVSPGHCLRELLALHGVKDHFSGFAFSDEVGHSKPHRSMFEAASRALDGVPFERMVHIGDRDHNDVKGPQALGMKAVLFTAVKDRGSAESSADAICAHAAELPATLERLATA